MKSSILLLILSGISTQLSATPLASRFQTQVCDGGTVLTLSSTWIGQAKNVEMKTVSCPDSQQQHQRRHDALVQRQTNSTNVCGAPCATNCFTPSGGGPDPNDCHVIADALRYDSQNIAALFQIGNGSTNNPVMMQYASCESFFVNQDFEPLVYCRTDWATLIDFIAPNCQATQNAHGGNCVANDQTWFVQVQHS